MRVLFAGAMPVHYGFVYLTSRNEPGTFDRARDGQRNGLCGAAIPHQLVMITGLHTGQVTFTAEWHAAEPPLDTSWEEVVEVPVVLARRDLDLASFEHCFAVDVPEAGPHRVRYCAAGMDAGHFTDSISRAETSPDRYLLQLWPAPAAPERIVRQTSEAAAYWHSVAQDT